MEMFILDNLEDGVLIIETIDSQLTLNYSNISCSRLLGVEITNLATIYDAFIEPILFEAAIESSLQTKSKSQQTFQIRKQDSILCKFIPHPNENKIFIYFKSLLEWLPGFIDILSKFNGVSSALIEFHQELQDWKYIHLSAKVLEITKKRGLDVVRKYARESNMLDETLISVISSKLSRVTNLYEKIEIELPFNNSESIYRAEFMFVGFSKDGFPLFLTHTVDISSVVEKENKLVEEKQVVDKIEEEYQLMRCFFNNTMVPMGTVQLHKEEKDFSILLMNACSRQDVKIDLEADIRHKRASEIFEDEVVQFWVEKYSECRNHAISFETESHTTGRSFSNILFSVGQDRYSWISVDVTPLKNAAFEKVKLAERLERNRIQELEDQLVLKGRFLATMSHELRTPISGISGALQLLSETNLSSEQSETVNIANVCTQQLLIEEHKMKLEEIPTSLYETVEDSIEVVSFEAEKKHLEIICDIDESAPCHFLGDHIRLRQILVNLLTNAIKFSHKGNIIIKVRGSKPNSDGKVEFTFCVKDQGIGISEVEGSSLFQPFIQADSSTTRKYGGSGLGLSICKRLCEMMGGRIWFESKVNMGSCFYFTILCTPFQKDEKDKIKPLQGKSIIVLQNNQDLVGVSLFIWDVIEIKPLQSVFTRCQSIVEFVANVEELSEKMKKQSYDFALLECNLMNCYRQLVSQWTSSCQIALLGFSSQLASWDEYKEVILLKKPIKFKSVINTLLKVVPVNIQQKKNQLKNGSRVLVAEDNKLNQQVIGKMLTSLGFDRVEFADNGKIAVEAALKKEFDIILMDVMMPEMGGKEATQIIREKTNKQPIIIALTADVLMENEGKLGEAGFDDIMTKPLNKQKFGDLLAKYCVAL